MNARELVARIDAIIEPIEGLRAEHAAKVARAEVLLKQLHELRPQGDQERWPLNASSADATVVGYENAAPKWLTDARRAIREAVYDYITEHLLPPGGPTT